MLPLTLLKSTQGHPVLVELKNGETYNGTLLSCDSWMNLHLREVILSSRDGDKFFRLSEAYIRGNTIKYMRVAEGKNNKDRGTDEGRKEESAAQRRTEHAVYTSLPSLICVFFLIYRS
jgi:U6 snRNA-associated Sm-like protein LSm4